MTMPTRRLGRTDHHSSVVVLGGAAFWSGTPERVEESFQAALDAGVNHVDIAPSYGEAESLVGPLIAPVRDQLFIGEKSNRYAADDVRRDLDRTLERFGTDHVDLYQAHGVTDVTDLERRADAFAAILRARDEGRTRFVGITGHDLGTPRAQLEALRRYDLDTVMFPCYPGVMADPTYAADVAALLDECARRDVGVHVIKAVAPQPWGDRERTRATWYEPWTTDERITEGVRFALSTPGVHVMCSPGDRRLLPAVLAAAASFEPLGDDERTEILGDAATWPTIFPLAEHAPR